MRNNNYLLHYLLVLVLIISGFCSYSQTSDLLEKIKISEKDYLKVNIVKDKSDNLIISLKDTHNYLYDASGVGNSDVVKTNNNVNFIKTGEFIKNKFSEYYFETYDVSSSFGANCIFIIWFDGTYWRITKSPFDKSIVRDINKDKLLEVVSLEKGNKRKVLKYHQSQFIVVDEMK
jgi:hypothetical protein